MEDANVCCGFGGTFCVKYPEVSNKMVTIKAEKIEASGADTLLAGDLGCLMNMAGKLQRRGTPVKVRHVAEVLAGMADGPGIGEGDPRHLSRDQPAPPPGHPQSTIAMGGREGERAGAGSPDHKEN